MPKSSEAFLIPVSVVPYENGLGSQPNTSPAPATEVLDTQPLETAWQPAPASHNISAAPNHRPRVRRLAAACGTLLAVVMVSGCVNGCINGCIGKKSQSNSNSGDNAADSIPLSNCTAGTDNTETVYTYLQQHVSIGSDAVNRAAWAGFIGNWKVEADGCLSTNPKGPSDGGKAHGFGQWENGRFDTLKAYAARQGGHWYDLTIQESFAVAEIHENHGGVVTDLKTTTDPTVAADLIAKDYEGCGVCNDTQREKEARAEYAKHPAQGAAGADILLGGRNAFGRVAFRYSTEARLGLTALHPV